MNNPELRLARAQAIIAAAARDRERLDRELRRLRNDNARLRQMIAIMRRALPNATAANKGDTENGRTA